MTGDEIRTKVVEVLGEVVPELEASSLRAGEPLRDQLDIDSMDFLNFAIGLHKAFGVEIPEADYRELATLDGCADYLAARIKPR